MTNNEFGSWPESWGPLDDDYAGEDISPAEQAALANYLARAASDAPPSSLSLDGLLAAGRAAVQADATGRSAVQVSSVAPQQAAGPPPAGAYFPGDELAARRRRRSQLLMAAAAVAAVVGLAIPIVLSQSGTVHDTSAPAASVAAKDDAGEAASRIDDGAAPAPSAAGAASSAHAESDPREQEKAPAAANSDDDKSSAASSAAASASAAPTRSGPSRAPVTGMASAPTDSAQPEPPPGSNSSPSSSEPTPTSECVAREIPGSIEGQIATIFGVPKSAVVRRPEVDFGCQAQASYDDLREEWVVAGQIEQLWVTVRFNASLVGQCEGTGNKTCVKLSRNLWGDPGNRRFWYYQDSVEVALNVYAGRPLTPEQAIAIGRLIVPLVR